MRPAVLALLSLAALWTGCVSLAGLTSGEGTDAGAEPADAPTADVEAGEGSAVVPDSGNTGPIPDAAAPDREAGFCAQQQGLQFCADFDESSLAYNWKGGLYLVDASMLQDDADFQSPPNSALVELAPFNSGKEVAKLQQSFMATPKTIHITMDLKLEQVDNSVEFLPLVLGFTNDTTGLLQISLDIAPAGWELYFQVFHADGGERQATLPFSPSPPFGSWTHVDLQLTFGSSGGNGTGVTASGVAGLGMLGPSSFATDVIAPPFEVDLGGQVLSASTAWRARLDNFTLSFQ
jgi:hypothetical protein